MYNITEIRRNGGTDMNCILRKWQFSDAKDLASALNNIKIINNLRDGLPFPYTEKDAKEYISAILSANENDTFAYAVTVKTAVLIHGKQPFESIFYSLLCACV